MNDVTTFVWKYNPETKRVHRHMTTGGAVMSPEQCNADQGDFEDIEESDALELLATGEAEGSAYCLPKGETK